MGPLQSKVKHCEYCKIRDTKNTSETQDSHRLLPSELIARKRQNLQPLLIVFIVQLGKLDIVCFC
jgi:hypothetical protein